MLAATPLAVKRMYMAKGAGEATRSGREGASPSVADTVRRDAALLERVMGGDREAASALVARFAGPVHGLALRLLGNEAEAEDITQDVFLRLWQGAGGWRGDAPLGHWLLRMTRNLCIDRLRGRKDTLPVEDAGLFSRDPDPFQQRQGRESGQLVQQAIMALPERQKTAITLVHHLDYTQKEAAGLMDISVEALESLLARGRRRLRRTLRPFRHALGLDAQQGKGRADD